MLVRLTLCALFVLLCACPADPEAIDGGTTTDSGVRPVADAGVVVTDSGVATTDSGVVLADAGVFDSGVVVTDAGVIDSGVVLTDAGVVVDAGTVIDAGGVIDAGVVDAGRFDAGLVDAGFSFADGGLRVFITRADYFPNLQHAVGVSNGLAAADVLCDSIAKSAYLPGTYKAWVSGAESDSALARTTGTGPWFQVQSDGGAQLAFVDRANLATRPLTGLNLNEFGAPYSEYIVSWTGTRTGGTSAPNTCLAFTSDSFTDGSGALGTRGLSNDTLSWTSTGQSPSCNSTGHLICFQQSHTPAAPTPGTGTKKVFITSTTHTGALGGLSGADALCAQRAAAASLPGTAWVAWLSSDTVNAFDRVADVGPWYQVGPDPILTFTNKFMLRSIPLALLNRDESGLVVTGDLWTGTMLGGAVNPARHCSGFTGTQGLAAYGSVDSLRGWTKLGTSGCDEAKRVVCFEQ